MENLHILIIFYAGMTHALEADHVLAVSNIISQRKSVWPSLKDGIFWGLGHSSTILIIGLIVLFLKTAIPANTFSYFEAIVGLMLIVVASYRLIRFYRGVKDDSTYMSATHDTTHHHTAQHDGLWNLHKLSYAIGLVHGLAGSGALLVLAMAQVTDARWAMIYLLIYGLGSVAGMALVSGLFSIPFSRNLINNPALRNTLILVSSGICIIYGAHVIIENLLM